MSALEHLISLAHHGNGCPSRHGGDICHCTINTARGEMQAQAEEANRLRAEVEALRQRGEDWKLILSRLVDAREASKKAWLSCVREAQDDAMQGFEDAYREARAALRKGQANG